MRSLVAALLIAGSSIAFAQGYPSKPVRIIVSYPPGGGSDLIARMVAAKLGEQTGQPFVVENRSGASGTIGAETVIKSPPDGYTILAGGNPEITLAPHLFERPGYDPVRDLAPLVLAAHAHAVIVAHPGLGAATLKEALALSRAKPGGLAYGTPGRGTPNHIAMELLERQTRASLTHVPYKGGGPAVTDVLAGTIPLAVINAPPLLPHIRAGRLRPLAVFHAERAKVLPEVPTVKEATGLERATASAWFAFMAPTRVPREILARLEAEIGKALADAAVRSRLMEGGLEVAALPSAKFAETIRTESAFHAQVLKQLDIRPD